MRALQNAKRAWVLFLPLLIFSSHAPAQEPFAPEGRPVMAVRVVSESGHVFEEIPAQLPLQPGQPYDAEVVRNSLRQVYRSGRFADVRAEASFVPGGVRVDFIVRENEFINKVQVTGLSSPQHINLALASLRLGLGEIFRMTDLAEAHGRLREMLVEVGFYEARIEPELQHNAKTRQVDITFRVDPGPRARIGQVTLVKLDNNSANDWLRRTKLDPGDRLSADALERGAERLRKHLFDKGHLGARVVTRRGEYDAANRSAPLQIEVFAGPKISVRVEGAKISGRQLRRLVPIYEEGAVDEDLLQEGRRDLRDYLETRGYFDSRVTYTIDDNPGTGSQEILYTVEPGPRRRLVGFAFFGNQYFSTELLRGRLRMIPAGFLARGRFSSRLLEDDTESIRELYLANGFREAEVKSERKDNYLGKEGDLFIEFHIKEGEQTRISELRIEGNSSLNEDELLAVVASLPGQPYSEFNMAGDRDNILATYFNEGFPEARFEAVTEPAAEPNRMRVTYRITEGPQVRVREILYSGHENARLGVIRREVQLEECRPLRLGSIVESQRRLYNLGVFNRVQIAPQNPQGTDTEKSIVVLVEEAKRYSIAYGGGVEVQRLGSGDDPTSGEIRASPRGIFELTRSLVGGRAHTFSFKIRASTIQGRALANYSAPQFLGRPNFSFQLTGFADKASDVRTFTSFRYEGSVQLVHELMQPPAFLRGSSFLYRYVYRRVQVDADTLKVNPAEVPLYSQPTKISSVGASWVRERRRDNPADATKGDFNTLDISIAPESIGSSASFVRLFAQNSTFHPIGRNLVFARSTRFGVQLTFGGTAELDVPLPERFFAGGGNSLRGFGLNQAGPRDATTGFPLGGLAMLLFNNELRFPMQLPFTALRLGGAVFYDAGNVFSNVSRITLRPTPPAPTDLNYFSHTIGFSIRYSTPIGPIRVDLGYLLNPARFQFTDANNVVRLDRPPRFQIFFNVGSLF